MSKVLYIPYSQAQMLDYGRSKGLLGRALENFMRSNFGRPWAPRTRDAEALDHVIERIRVGSEKL